MIELPIFVVVMGMAVMVVLAIGGWHLGYEKGVEDTETRWSDAVARNRCTRPNCDNDALVYLSDGTDLCWDHYCDLAEQYRRN